jgi:hydrogenase maturation protease
MSRSTPLLVLGLGNVLLGDDGVGAAAITRMLEEYRVPAGARVLDGGTLGLSLLPYLQEAEAVILVDAIRSEAPAGSLVRLDGDQVAPAVATRLSVHQVGVADLLDSARWLDQYPTRLVLLGIVPESMDLTVGLSLAVARSIPDLVQQVVDEAGALGFAFTRQRGIDSNETSDALGAVDIARPVWVR